jgi:hypothetical protein
MPEYQYKLRPHHDASTYTINLALNDVEKDYEVSQLWQGKEFFYEFILSFKRGVDVDLFAIIAQWHQQFVVGH